jgi:uncharacterized membrane protein HdeD (DUF308 family)
MEYELARNWWLLALRGGLAILFGVLVLFWPVLGLVVMVASFAAYALVDGGFAIAAAVTGPATGRRWWGLLLEGLLGISAGVLTIVWPEITLIVLIYLIAAWAVATGVFEVVAAVRLRKVIEGEWALALSGILSIVFGVAVAILPGPGAVAIAWMLAAYSIVFGTLLLVLGFRLRALARQAPRPASPTSCGGTSSPPSRGRCCKPPSSASRTATVTRSPSWRGADWWGC